MGSTGLRELYPMCVPAEVMLIPCGSFPLGFPLSDSDTCCRAKTALDLIQVQIIDVFGPAFLVNSSPCALCPALQLALF